MGLNESFTTIRGQILLMTPLPDLGQAYAMLLRMKIKEIMFMCLLMKTLL